ncbi:MAG: hypothetical protein JWM98_1674 [Thermoleophilia bacterium]|nr:hypothetical protein [Thermoleophilia bacterium]
MPARHDNRPARTRSRTHEAGFGVIELIVAMVILAILLAAIMLSFRGAKSSTYAKETKAAASAYAQAIGQYQADHANLNPTGLSGTAGPLNLLGKPYLRAVPDAVAGGRVSVSLACGAPAGGSFGHISYCAQGAGPAFDIKVWTRASASEGWTPAPTCHLGNANAIPRC